MIIFVALLLAAVTFGFIVYPFYRQRRQLVTPAGDERLQELYSRRDTTYSMLKELEFDYRSGLLSEEDFQELESRYKGKAVSILKSIDGFQEPAPAGTDAEIEREVAALRQGRRRRATPRGKGVTGQNTEIDAEIEKEVLALRQGEGRFCSQCGAESSKGDRFCSHCGARLS